MRLWVNRGLLILGSYSAGGYGNYAMHGDYHRRNSQTPRSWIGPMSVAVSAESGT